MAIPAIAVALPIVGFVGFVAFATAATGTSTLDAQDAWGGRNFHAPWEVAAASLQWALDHQDPLQLLNLIGLAGFSVLLIFGVRRLPIAYTLLAAPQLLLLATRIQPTPLTGTLRYLVVVFPVFVLLGQVGDRRLQFGWALGSSLFLALLAARFFGGEFVA
jgi:hypothetical protein